MSKIPVIIDCDPGIDDSIAIIMLAGSEKVDIKAITTTHGNVGLEGTTKNALGLRELLGLDCLVAKGAAKPMIVPLKNASEIHGANGLANYDLPQPQGTFEKEAAWDVMYRLAKEENGEMVLVVLGPMTNLALTILKYPDFKNYVKRVYMMGGSRDYGNHSPTAEFNIWGDPHACQVVLKSGIPVTMADLEFTYSNAVTGAQMKELYSHGKKLKPMLDAFIAHDTKRCIRQAEEKGIPADFDNYKIVICDSSASAALLLDGDCLETEDYYVVCETQSTENEGQTVFDYKGHLRGQPNVQLCMKIDKEKYLGLIRDAVAHFE